MRGHWGETDWLDTSIRENNGKENDHDYLCHYYDPIAEKFVIDFYLGCEVFNYLWVRMWADVKRWHTLCEEIEEYSKWWHYGP